MVGILVVCNSIAFLIYGLLCLLTGHMMKEFERYGLARFRRLTGLLELCGGLGSAVGFFFFKPLFTFSTLGLTILMFLGVITRIRVKDPYFEIIPAFALMALNGYLVWFAVS